VIERRIQERTKRGLVPPRCSGCTVLMQLDVPGSRRDGDKQAIAGV
jgi:hypothetical protein